MPVNPHEPPTEAQAKRELKEVMQTYLDSLNLGRRDVVELYELALDDAATKNE